MAPSSSCPSGSQTARSRSRNAIPNAYAPWVPSPLNPNPKEHISPRASRRIIRRVSKPASSTSTSSQSRQAQAPKHIRTVSTAEWYLRRKLDESIRVRHLIQQRDDAPATATKQHRATSHAQRSQRTGGAKSNQHPSMVNFSITDSEKRAQSQSYEYDEWNLDMNDGHDMEEIDLDLMERKLGIGWQEEEPALEMRQQEEESRRRKQRFRLLGALKRPTRGVLLAVALVCLCGLPALRGQTILRRIGAFAMGL